MNVYRSALIPRRLPCPNTFLVTRLGICNKSHCGGSIRHFDIRSGKHIGVTPLTKKKIKPVNNRAAHDHLLYCVYLSSFDNFSIFARENKKFLLEIKESLLIMIDKPLINRNISPTPSHLSDNSMI